MRITHALFLSVMLVFGFVAHAQNLESEIAIQLLLRDLPLSTDDGLPMVDAETQALDATTDLVRVTLTPAKLAPIHLTLRGPTGFYESFDANLGTLLLVSGFAPGAESVKLIGGRNDSVVAGFEYPFTAEDFMRDPGLVAQFVRQTPAQILLTIQWLQMQGWMRPNGLTVMGVSLGGIALPVSLHLAQASGVQVPRTIFAFTGANLTPILAANLQGAVPDGMVRPLVQMLDNLMTLHDPQLHLPVLQGNFLVLRADADQVIPAESTERLFDLLSGQKSEIVLHGPHINVDQADLIRQTQDVVWKWISEQL